MEACARSPTLEAEKSYMIRYRIFFKAWLWCAADAPDCRGKTMKSTNKKAPSRRGRPLKGTEDESLERILDAAAASFLQFGYAATSIDGVTAAAGVSKTTFYGRFESKAALFAEVARRWIGQGTEFPELGDEDNSAAVRDRLHAVALSMLSMALKPEVIAFDRIISTETVRFPELASIHQRLGTVHGVRAIEDCLRAGVERGELVLDDIGFAADFFLTVTIRGPLRKAVLSVENVGLSPRHRRELDRTIKLFLDGARKREAS